jgi:PIN domain nuclease of toxin-antitoxin system
VWEIAIKRSLGKLTAPEDLPDRIAEEGFAWLPISAVHAWQVRDAQPTTEIRSTA